MPFFLPVFAFAAAIGAGGFLLGLDVFATRPVHPVDALFLATSAVCVTGLAPFDIFAVYTRPGQCVVLALVQLGGIGIFTYATLFVHLMGRRISLTDRVAVEQGLFYDHGFSLSAFGGRAPSLLPWGRRRSACSTRSFFPSRHSATRASRPGATVWSASGALRG